MKINKTVQNLLVGAGLMSVATASFAAVDVTAVVAEVTAAHVPVALVGAAVLTLMVGIKVYRWVNKALF